MLNGKGANPKRKGDELHHVLQIQFYLRRASARWRRDVPASLPKKDPGVSTLEKICARLTPRDRPRNHGVTTCLPRQETHHPSSNTTDFFAHFFFIINPKFILRAPIWWSSHLFLLMYIHIRSHRRRDCRVFFLPILHPFLSATSLQHKFPPYERPNSSPLNTFMSFLFFFSHFS